MGEWVEIRATGPRANIDEATSLLIGAGSPAVVEGEAVIPPKDVFVLLSSWEEPPGVPGFQEEKGEAAALTAHLRDEGGLEKRLSGLKSSLDGIGWCLAVKPYKDLDWTIRWKRGVRPQRVACGGRSVFIRPTWSRARKRPGDVLVEIDPGMAFGTGSHATTKTCLRALLVILYYSRRKISELSLLDVGTGTGVLAIAAKKLGFGRALGIDIDRVAARVARENARRNKASVKISTIPVERTSGKYSVVIANILSGELKRLAPSLYERTDKGGYIILSGLLNEEVKDVRAAYEALGLHTVKSFSGGGWATVIFWKGMFAGDRGL